MHQKTVIIICGPTAVGKTDVAIQLATAAKTQIISADSRQCFRELSIGVAKPSVDQLAAVHHYFINSHSIYDNVNAGLFAEFALKAATEIFKQNDVAVMVGGTGLYIKAFKEGIDEIPEVDAAIRQQITEAYQQNGLGYLQKQVAEKDPKFWAVAEQQNPKRLSRALEVVLSTGKSILDFRAKKPLQHPFNIINVGLELPRNELYNRINSRVDVMVENGLVGEAKSLYPYRQLNALQTVGYRELFQHFDGEITLQSAIENIKTNSRHYAKRQLTWFKKDETIQWISPSDFNYENILTTYGL